MLLKWVTLLIVVNRNHNPFLNFLNNKYLSGCQQLGKPEIFCKFLWPGISVEKNMYVKSSRIEKYSMASTVYFF